MSLFQHQPANRRFARFARRFDIRQSDFLRPLAILGALALLIITLGVHVAARAIDDSSERREHVLVQNGITQRIAEVAQMIVPQVDWDDAVTNLDNHYDASWAEANIGKFLSQTDGFDQSFVVAADGHPLFAAIGSSVAPAARYAPVAPVAASLITQVRNGERRRGPIKASINGAMVSRPIQASTLAMIEGRIAIVTATLIQPDFGKALPATPGAPVAVTVMDIDRAFLDQFSTRYLLKGLHIAPIGARAVAGETRIAARDEHGQLIAWFAWAPFTPGYAMLRTSALPVLIAGLGLALLAFLQLRQVQRAAGYLIWREKQVRALAHFDPVTSLPNEHFLREDIGHRLAGDEGAFSILVAYPEPGKSSAMNSDEDHQALARRLQRACPADGLLARLSDGGFAFLAPTATAADAEQLRVRLAGAMAGAPPIDCLSGLAFVVDGSRSATEILQSARADLRA